MAIINADLMKHRKADLVARIESLARDRDDERHNRFKAKGEADDAKEERDNARRDLADKNRRLERIAEAIRTAAAIKHPDAEFERQFDAYGNPISVLNTAPESEELLLLRHLLALAEGSR